MQLPEKYRQEKSVFELFQKDERETTNWRKICDLNEGEIAKTDFFAYGDWELYVNVNDGDTIDPRKDKYGDIILGSWDFYSFDSYVKKENGGYTARLGKDTKIRTLPNTEPPPGYVKVSKIEEWEMKINVS